MTYTDEKLTELECVIDDYCRAATAKGFALTTTGNCSQCVLAAVASVAGDGYWARAYEELGIGYNDAIAVAKGFDGNPGGTFAGPLYDMGQRFRERVLAGEYMVTGATR